MEHVNTATWTRQDLIDALAMSEKGLAALGSELDAAREKLATLAGGINKWCADCELRHDCIAPNGEPCDLKDAHIAATTLAGMQGEQQPRPRREEG